MTRVALAVITVASLLAASLGLNSLTTTSRPATQTTIEPALAPLVATQVTAGQCVVAGDLVGDGNPAEVANALCP